MNWTRLLSLSMVAASSLALPTNDTPAPLPPSKDPWYTAPAGFESASPGAILRIRPAPGNSTTIFSNSSQAFNILYRSTDTHYLPSWAVTTLFVPKQGRGTELLSYQIPYNSADVDASPSYALYAPVAGSALRAINNNDIQTALSMGWYVNVPDHEGPLASFLEGVQEGHNVLDSVRAALSTNCGLSKDARYAMWGYSGGSVASENAAELQVQYAPELNFAGAAVGGLVSNLTAAISSINGSPFTGLIPSALVGLTTQYPDAYKYLVSQLKTSGAYNKTTFLSVKNLSFEEAVVVFSEQDAFKYFKNGADILKAPVMQNVIDREGTDQLVDRYCSVGVDVLYERNSIGGHIAEGINGDRRAFDWLGKVLSGTYNHTGCETKTVAINITDSPL